MKLNVLGSSSAGNCYILTDSAGRAFILEAGIHPQKVKRALGYDISRVCGCAVSHRHGDHAAHIRGILSWGVSVWANADTWQAQETAHPLAHTIEAGGVFKAGPYTVATFAAEHDAPCLGFVIMHREMGTLLFATDTMLLPVRVPRLAHIMIEANYTDEDLRGNLAAGVITQAQADRTATSHMELSAAIQAIQAQDASRLQTVVLLHLSPNNADPVAFRRTAEQSTGMPVEVARPGLVLDLTLIK